MREKRAPYVRTPRATARGARRVRADAPQAASPQEEASRTIVLHGAQVPDDVVQFCEREGVLEYLLLADRLIARLFPDARKVDVRFEVDPETGEESAVIDMLISGEIDEILARSSKYTASWVQRVPWPERGKIHLLYAITGGFR